MIKPWRVHFNLKFIKSGELAFPSKQEWGKHDKALAGAFQLKIH